MSKVINSAAMALMGVLSFAQALSGQDVAPYEDVAARIWFDRGEEPLLERGEQVRIYYRTTADAYVAIFNIDTNGTVRLVFPRSPEDAHYVRGEHDYRLLFPGSEYWFVDDHPGMGYFFAVASLQPFDFSGIDYSYYDRGWDLTRIGQAVYTDPYVAMDDYVAALVPDWEYIPYALDFATYHVGDVRQEYPRFLCYDCHGFRPYAAWDPYLHACTSFRVVVYTDPWYYPSFRYRGDRVVYARPPRPGVPRFEFKERAIGDPTGVEYVTRPAVPDRPGVGGDPALRRPSPSAAAPTTRPSAVGEAGANPRPVSPTPGLPEDLSRLRRGGSADPAERAPGRPSQVLPGRGEPADASGLRRAVPPTSTGARPILERRSGGNEDDADAIDPAMPGAGGQPGRITAPDPVREGTSVPSGGNPPARVAPSTGSGSTGSGTVRPTALPPGGPATRTTPPVRPSQGVRPGARPSSSTPVIRRNDPSGSGWVPVLGGSRDRGAAGSSTGATPPDGPSRRGVVIFEGTPDSPGYTITREGGVTVIRGSGGSGSATGRDEPSPAARTTRARSQEERPAAATPARPSQGVLPTRAGSPQTSQGSVGRAPSSAPARATPPTRVTGGSGARSTGAVAPRSAGRSAPTGGSPSTPARTTPTVRRSGGAPSSAPSGTARSSGSGRAPSAGGAVIRRR